MPNRPCSLDHARSWRKSVPMGCSSASKSDLGPTWSQLGPNLDPTWAQLGPICRSISIFARSCSKSKKPGKNCGFVDIRACRHGLQIAPDRSWAALLTRCCLRGACAWAPMGCSSAPESVLGPTWTQLGLNLEPRGPLGPSLGPFRTYLRTPQTFKTQLGPNLEPTWSQPGANLDCLGHAQDVAQAAQ